VKVYKYSKNPPDYLKPSSHRIFELPGRKLDSHPVAYVTPDLYDLAVWARKYLSITYFPTCRSLFKLVGAALPVTDNTGGTIDDELSLERVPRVWPAFGRDGGAREALLIADPDSLSKFKPEVPVHRLPDGGKDDSYHQDNVQDHDIKLAIEIAQATWDAAGQLDLGDRVLRFVGGKVSEDAFPVVTARRSSYHYTLSVGYTILGNYLRVKVWGYVWSDDVNLRHICGPLNDVFSLDLWRGSPALTERTVKDRLQRRLERHQHPYHLFLGAAKNVLTRAVGMEETYFSTYSRTMALP